VERLSDKELIDAALAKAERLGMKTAEFARRVRRSSSTVKRWKRGDYRELQDETRAFLEAFIHGHEPAMGGLANGAMPDTFAAGKAYAIAHMRGFLAGLEAQPVTVSSDAAGRVQPRPAQEDQLDPSGDEASE